MGEIFAENDFFTDKYQIEKILNKDKEHAIYRCKYRKSHIILKQIFPYEQEKENENLNKIFLDRCKNIQDLKHKNIVQIEDYFIDKNTYYVVMEQVNGRNLEEIYQQDYKKTYFPVDILLKYMTSVCDTLVSMNKKKPPLVCGHLSTTTIMVTVSDEIKLINFGIKHIARNGKNSGHSDYASPEQTNNKNIDYKSDIFSLGAIMYYLLSGKKINKDKNIEKLSKINKSVSRQVEELIMSCLWENPEQRPELSQLSSKLRKLLSSETIRIATKGNIQPSEALTIKIQGETSSEENPIPPSQVKIEQKEIHKKTQEPKKIIPTDRGKVPIKPSQIQHKGPNKISTLENTSQQKKRELPKKPENSQTSTSPQLQTDPIVKKSQIKLDSDKQNINNEPNKRDINNVKKETYQNNEKDQPRSRAMYLKNVISKGLKKQQEKTGLDNEIEEPSPVIPESENKIEITENNKYKETPFSQKIKDFHQTDKKTDISEQPFSKEESERIEKHSTPIPKNSPNRFLWILIPIILLIIILLIIFFSKSS